MRIPGKIEIELSAGLCNRMRALDSAIQLAKLTNSQLSVIWNLEKKFNCNFEELFVVPKRIAGLVNRDVRTLPAIIARRFSRCDRREFDNCFYQKDVARLIRAKADFEKLTKGKSTFISTFSKFFSRGRNFEDFAVAEALLKLISSYTDQFDHVVGVHIRRTDNKKATKGSPTSLFIKYMEKQLVEYPESRFFLATDSPEVEAQLVGIFGGKIIVHPKRSLDRNDPAAIKDALVDLYCLASCRKILGSYWSSFTDTASEIAGAEKVIVKG